MKKYIEHLHIQPLNCSASLSGKSEKVLSAIE